MINWNSKYGRVHAHTTLWANMSITFTRFQRHSRCEQHPSAICVWLYIFNKTYAHIISMSMFSMLIYIYDIFLGVVFSLLFCLYTDSDRILMPTQYLSPLSGALSLSSLALFTLISSNKHIQNANAYWHTRTQKCEPWLKIQFTHAQTTKLLHAPYYFYRWCMPYRRPLNQMQLW